MRAKLGTKECNIYSTKILRGKKKAVKMTYLSKYHTRKNPVLISLKTSKRRKVYHVEQADVILLDQ